MLGGEQDAAARHVATRTAGSARQWVTIHPIEALRCAQSSAMSMREKRTYGIALTPIMIAHQRLTAGGRRGRAVAATMSM